MTGSLGAGRRRILGTVMIKPNVMATPCAATRRASALAGGLSAALALAAAPAQAQTTFSGVGEAALGVTNVNVASELFDTVNLDDEFANVVIAGAGAVAGPVTGRLGFQADAAVDAFFDTEDDIAAQIVFNQGHLYYRDSERFAAGGGLNTVSAYGDSGVDAFGANVEGDLYFDRLSATGNIAFYDFDNFDSTAFGGQGKLDFFPRRHMRFGGAVTYGRQDDVSTFWRAQFEAEFQRPGAPLSLVVSFANTEETIEDAFFDDTEVSTQSFRIGGRYYFSGLSLFAFDRSGASRDGGAFLLDAASGF